VRKGEEDPYEPAPAKGEEAASEVVHGEGGSKYRVAYYSFPEEFTSNLSASDAMVQLSLAASTRYDGRVLMWLAEHQLAIRSRLLVEIANTDEADIATPEGKARLTEAADRGDQRGAGGQRRLRRRRQRPLPLVHRAMRPERPLNIRRARREPQRGAVRDRGAAVDLVPEFGRLAERLAREIGPVLGAFGGGRKGSEVGSAAVERMTGAALPRRSVRSPRTACWRSAAARTAAGLDRRSRAARADRPRVRRHR
jgi:hypothetical protein